MAIDDLLHLYRDTYYKLPQPVKSFLGGIYGNIPLSVRFGKHYVSSLQCVKQFEQWDTQKQLDFIYNKTYETLLFAQEHIDYYSRLFAEYQVSIRDFKEPFDITLFPRLTKEAIKKHLGTMYSAAVQVPTPYYTGGSTSSPTKYYLPLNSSRGKEKAYNEYIFSKIGKKHRDKTLLLKGREVAKPEKSIYWEYEPVDNYLVVSSNYLNSDKFALIYDRVQRFGPKFVFGYPSAVLDFVKLAKNNGVDSYLVKGVILTSEMVLPEEQKIIRDFFGCNVLVKYGHTERAALGYSINGGPYKLQNSYGLVRCVKNELVVTSFDNFVMPFINYRTNDFFGGSKEFYPGTDIAMSAQHIEGRIQEYLVTKDHRLVSIVVMGAGHYSSLSNVNAIQYQQNRPGYVTLLVQSEEPIDQDLIKKQLENFTKDGIVFDVKLVPKVEKTSRGKRVLCKQSLDIDKYRIHSEE